MRAHICAYMRVCMCARTCAYTGAYMCAHMGASMRAYTRACMRGYMMGTSLSDWTKLRVGWSQLHLFPSFIEYSFPATHASTCQVYTLYMLPRFVQYKLPSPTLSPTDPVPRAY